jgi:CRP-like cAMP-binding protein
MTDRPSKPLSEAEQVGIEAGWLGREPEAFRKGLLDIARIRRLPAGATMYMTDDDADTFVGLAAGHLAFRSALVTGTEVVAHIGSAGMWFGTAMIPVSRLQRRLTVDARTDVTVAMVPLPSLRRWLSQRPEGWESIARQYNVDWELTYCIGRDLMLRGHRDRIVATLLRLAGLRPTMMAPSPHLTIPATHEEIACMSNCSHSLVSAELRLLSDAKLVELAYGSIRIIDPAGLLSVLTKSGNGP